MSEHAPLSPSAAERWTTCTASVLLAAEVEEQSGGQPESAYAREGTAEHKLCEIYASHLILGKLSEKEFSKAVLRWRTMYADVIKDEDEMVDYALAWVDLLTQKLEERPGSRLFLEQRVDTGVTQCWGTSDAIILSANHLEAIDLKYGMGIQVQAVGNPQLRLYGIGALRAFDGLLGDIEHVQTTVWQPRLQHVDTEILSIGDLIEWVEAVVAPAAEAALSGNGEFRPSADACRWCPASGNCAAQMEYFTQSDFATPPDQLTPADLAEALEMLPGIEAWVAAVREHALQEIYGRGKIVPGWKVVQSGGRRAISDPDGATEALRTIGWDDDDILKPPGERKLKGITDLTRLLGSRAFDSIVGPYVKKSQGKPALVPEEDSRPSLTADADAARTFGAADNE